MENLTQGWIQSEPFFQKSIYQKGQERPLPSRRPPICMPVSVVKNASIINIPEYA